MGLLVDGRWQDKWYDTSRSGGRFERQASQFRNWVTVDGSAGDGGFRAEAGRYCLYVSLACPWAHRTLIFRRLKGLEDIVETIVVDPRMGEEGWVFGDFPGATPDHVNGAKRLYEVYLKAAPGATTRVTVPVLWDKARETIVSNESAEIIRMFNSAFNGLTGNERDLYPAALRSEIDALNARVYDRVNNGVYRAGFATSQEAYEEASRALFDELDALDARLADRRYLFGAQLTEADVRLFTTLVRFDAVYVGHFKCNRRRIADYAHLSGYLRDLYQTPGVGETVDFAHIKTHYYSSHPTINPTRIIPIGPEIDLDAPHGRDRL